MEMNLAIRRTNLKVFINPKTQSSFWVFLYLKILEDHEGCTKPLVPIKKTRKSYDYRSKAWEFYDILIKHQKCSLQDLCKMGHY
jgi:hypothetical protein